MSEFAYDAPAFALRQFQVQSSNDSQVKYRTKEKTEMCMTKMRLEVNKNVEIYFWNENKCSNATRFVSNRFVAV